MSIYIHTDDKKKKEKEMAKTKVKATSSSKNAINNPVDEMSISSRSQRLYQANASLAEEDQLPQYMLDLDEAIETLKDDFGLADTHPWVMVSRSLSQGQV